MNTDDLHVVVGLGVSGYSSVRYLHGLGKNVAVIDTRDNPPQLALLRENFPDIPLALGTLDENLLKKAHTIVLSPGISLQEPLIAARRKAGVPVIGDIELFARDTNQPVAAITGTNAKSTVTTLVAKMGEANQYHVGAGGNLGTPALDLLAKTKTNLFVLELSSFQLETTNSLSAKVASILNITADHMDRYATLRDYQQAKQRIYHHCHTAVFNADDALTHCLLQPQKSLSFTIAKPKKNQFGFMVKGGEEYLAFEDELLLPCRELPNNGKHEQLNALSALAIGYGLGFSMPKMLSVLKTFQGLPHRCQWVRERQGVKWYNDSKGTNVGATQAAIYGLGKTIQGKWVLIAGGMGKNADFTPLVPLIKQYVKHTVLIGEAAPELAQLFSPYVSVSQANSMQEAVQKAALIAEKHDGVLLSPACASMDMFRNYEDRGCVYMKWVNELE